MKEESSKLRDNTKNTRQKYHHKADVSSDTDHYHSDDSLESEPK